MKKTVFLLLFVIFSSKLFCQSNNLLYKTEQKNISDFSERIKVRDRLNQLRNYSNYAYPKILHTKEKFSEAYNQDVSSSIYVAYYILRNLEEEYVSQDLFSEIVECLKCYPKDSYNGYYSKIYIAENLQISNILCFFKNDEKFQIDIYDNNSKKSIILSIHNYVENIQKEYRIEYTDYKNTSIMFPKDFIEAAWYAMWDYQWEETQTDFWEETKTDFIVNNHTEELYSMISKELSMKSWSEFCNNFESIIFLEEIFEKLYYKPDYLERMIFTELIQRCLIAGM